MSDDDAPPRLAPLPREQFGDIERAALRAAYSDELVQGFLSTGSDARPVPNVLATLLRHPALAGPWLAYNNVLLWSSALDDRLRELMVLRVAWSTRSRYEWVQHVLLASRFGVTPVDVDAIARGVVAEAWTPLERALVAATDQLLDHHRIDEDTWTQLAGQLDDRQLVETVFVVGTYTCLAMAFNSFGVQLDPGTNLSAVPPFPE